MKLLRHLHYAFLCAAGITIWNGCGASSTAGGSEIGNPSPQPGHAILQGSVLSSSSVDLSVDSFTVRLRPKNYLKSLKTTGTPNTHWDTVTNPAGEFTLTKLDTGRYLLEVSDLSRKGVVQEVYISNDATTILPPLTLQELHHVRGGASTEDSSKPDIYVQIYGLERSLSVTQKGIYLFNNIPSGTYTFRVSANSSFLQPAEKVVDVSVRDTVEVENINLTPFFKKWKYSRTYYLNTSHTGALLSKNLYDFPVRVQLTRLNFDFTQSNGTDLRFSKADGTPLAHDIDSWDSNNEVGYVWVRMDTLYANKQQQQVQIYWGNQSANTFEPGTVFNASNQYSGVWHGSLDGQQVLDVTENNNHAHAVGGLHAGNQVAGQLGSSIYFNGLDQYLEVDNLQDIPTGNQPYTISAWILPVHMNKAGIVGWGLYDSKGTANALRLSSQGGGGIRNYWFNQDLEVYSSDLSEEWHYIAATYNGYTRSIYLDGQLLGTDTPTGHNVASDRPLTIGMTYFTEFFHGQIDELRISKKARSHQWIQMNYANQKSGERLSHFDLREWMFQRAWSVDLQSLNLSENRQNISIQVVLDSNNFNFQESHLTGKDLRFHKANGELLPYKIETWNPANKEATIWVQLDIAYAHLNTQSIYMSWGHPFASDYTSEFSISVPYLIAF